METIAENENGKKDREKVRQFVINAKNKDRNGHELLIPTST
jgi:hypothetical protein